MGIILNKYCNDHGIKYYQLKLKDSEGGSKSNSTLFLPKGTNNSDFTTVTSTKNSKEEKKAGKSESRKQLPPNNTISE